MGEQFDGKGFDKGEFTPEERAVIRHLTRVLQENFREMDDATLKAVYDGATLVRAVVILYSIVKVGGPVGLVALGAGAFLRSQGWL